MTLEEAFRKMELNLEEELKEDSLSWKKEETVDEIKRALEEAISTYNPKNIRYFYYWYKGKVVCIPEWYWIKCFPRNMEEMEEIARIWSEKNERGDFGQKGEE